MNSRFVVLLLIMSALVMGWSGSSRASTPEEVEAAIKKARDYLHKQQNADGNWEVVKARDPKGAPYDVKGSQWGGLTAISTYALLAAGDDAQTDLAKPIKFLKDSDVQGIYAIGLRCQVWLLDRQDKKLHAAQERDKQILLSAIRILPAQQNKDYFGFYSYFFDKTAQPVDQYDRSVSQYGVLGVWALDQAGSEIPLNYWKLVDFAWKRAQNADGGWNYQRGFQGNGASTIPMTAAGIATLFITQDYTLGALSECKGNIVNVNIDKGLAWMDKQIKPALNSGNFYAMYGIERIGVASGRKYFDVVDWYRDGSDFIAKHQNPDGSWGGGVPDTCFALLFLVRGRAPVVINKLEYSTLEHGKVVDGPWNERPRDCANFARWMGRNIEHDLNWQVVNLKVGAEQLHDAPILYIAGNKELFLSREDIATLRTFAEQGGLIIGNADCANLQFSRSFEDLGKKLFPNYPMKDLPISHLIFNEQYKASNWKKKLKVQGVSNGVRELMIMIPDADLSRAFQSRNEKLHEEVYQLAANIFLYAVDKKNLHNKGETFIVNPKPEIVTTRDLTVARLQVGDMWDPEPAGWRRMIGVLHNEDKVNLTVTPAKLDAASLKGIKVAHLTGTTAINLTDADRKTIKDFVEGGGTLIIDSAGGGGGFAGSIEPELKAIFGKETAIIPMNAQVYNLPASRIDTIKYRNFAIHQLTGGLKASRVRAIEVKGRPAVFYSPEDLSGGMVGEPVDGVVGYDPATATAIMRNLIMFGGFGFPKPPATQPTTAPSTQPTTQPSTNPATAPATSPAAVPPATPEPVAK